MCGYVGNVPPGPVRHVIVPRDEPAVYSRRQPSRARGELDRTEPDNVTVYDPESIDPDALNTSHAQVAALVGRDKTVLDLGCSTGDLGRLLVSQGCTVDGVEIDPEAAATARQHLRNVVVADLERADLAAALGETRYDRVVMADVLGHLVSPGQALRAAASLLAEGGEIVLSVPNVAHGALRLALLQGRWDYREAGLLDRNRVRFFNRDSIVQLVRDAGLCMEHMRATVKDPLSTEVGIDEGRLPLGLVDWVRTQREGFDYEYILRARPGRTDEEPDVIPAVVLPEMEEGRRRERELREADTAQLERIALWRKVLTLRDHVIGAEAELGNSRAEMNRLIAERDEARRAANEMRASMSFRLGNLVVGPAKKVRQRWRDR